METFFQTHAYLIEQTNAPVRRALMDSIDWNYRMIGIKGPRGVGKTTFLLQYAKENFEPGMRQCLYVNMNSFYFQGRGLVDFADEFYRGGGQVLLVVRRKAFGFGNAVYSFHDVRYWICLQR